jgi:hypothetical protein
MLSASIPAVASAQTVKPDAVGAVAEFSSWFVTAQAQYSANIISSTLEQAMKRSRDSAREGSQPIPDEIRAALSPYYSDAVMDEVRFKVGDTSPDGLAGFAIRNGNAAAVTLIDTIVFKEEKYTHNIALWAHEMHHIEQYHDWGVAGFASRYAFGWEAVEQEARDRADDFVAWYKAKHP